MLRSISALSRYEAASGTFQVVVNLDRRVSWLPSFIEGTQTLFVGQGTDIAFVDFSKLKGSAIKVSHNRKSVTILVPRARLEPAVLNVKRSYVFAQQQGLLNRIGNFFSGNPNSQHQVYVVAQRKIQHAAQQQPAADASAAEHQGDADRLAQVTRIPANHGDLRPGSPDIVRLR